MKIKADFDFDWLIFHYSAVFPNCQFQREIQMIGETMLSFLLYLWEEANLDSRANFFLAFENLMDALKPDRGPSVREKERPGVEVGRRQKDCMYLQAENIFLENAYMFEP